MPEHLILLLTNSEFDRMKLIGRQAANSVVINPADGKPITMPSEGLAKHGGIAELRRAEALLCLAPLNIQTDDKQEHNAKVASRIVKDIEAAQFVLGIHPPANYRTLLFGYWLDVNHLAQSPVTAEIYSTSYVEFEELITKEIVPACLGAVPFPEAFAKLWAAFERRTEKRFDGLSISLHDILKTFIPLSLDIQYVIASSDRREALTQVCRDHNGFIEKWETLHYFLVGNYGQPNLTESPPLPDGLVLADHVRPNLHSEEIASLWTALLELAGLRVGEGEKFNSDIGNPQYRFMDRLESLKHGRSAANSSPGALGDNFGDECQAFVSWVEKLNQTLIDLRAKVTSA